MAEELEQVSTETTSQNENINRTEERIKDLSSKVKSASQERDEALAKANAEAEARQKAEKKAEFLEKFSDVSTKYQGATEYRSAIEEKVLKGYDIEDATVSVLNAEGKLQPIVQTQSYGSAGGGSSSTVIPQGDRGVDQMTQAERRAELEKLSGGEMMEAFKDASRR